MSAFPYITTSPPPTAGPLPVIERANLNTPYSGGGGGGGPSTIGPNPVVSSITTNGGWAGGIPSTFDVAGAGQGLAIGGNNVQTIALGCSTLTEVDIIGPNLNEVVINGGKLAVINCFSGRAATETASMSLNISTPNGHIYTLLPDAGTFLEIQSDSRYPTPSQPTCGSLELGALPDGRSYVGAALGYSAFGLSTLMLLGDGVNISSLNVSSIKSQGFQMPLVTYGATTLNAGGSTIVGLDHTYTIPYYQLLTYRGTPTAATHLFASTIDGQNFVVYGQPNLTFQYAIFGN